MARVVWLWRALVVVMVAVVQQQHGLRPLLALSVNGQQPETIPLGWWLAVCVDCSERFEWTITEKMQLVWWCGQIEAVGTGWWCVLLCGYLG
jgi:hypothetical protein